jgi:hypothetical protein
MGIGVGRVTSWQEKGIFYEVALVLAYIISQYMYFCALSKRKYIKIKRGTILVRKL